MNYGGPMSLAEERHADAVHEAIEAAREGIRAELTGLPSGWLEVLCHAEGVDFDAVLDGKGYEHDFLRNVAYVLYVRSDKDRLAAVERLRKFLEPSIDALVKEKAAY